VACVTLVSFNSLLRKTEDVSEQVASYDKARAVMSAAPRPLTFKNGIVLMMSPLRDKDIAELDHWVQARYLQTAKLGLNQAEYDSMYPSLVSRAMVLCWYSGEGLTTITTVDGLAKLIFVSCCRNHPELTLDFVRSCLIKPDGNEDDESILEFNRVFSLLNNTGTTQRFQNPVQE
jgi:hypothetical protein